LEQIGVWRRGGEEGGDRRGALNGKKLRPSRNLTPGANLPVKKRYKGAVGGKEKAGLPTEELRVGQKALFAALQIINGLGGWGEKKKKNREKRSDSDIDSCAKTEKEILRLRA